MAGAACHEEVFQCPARWMSSTTEECNWDGGPRAGNQGDTSCTSFWRRAVRNSIGAAKHGYDALNMRNVFRKIPRREHDVAEEGLWRRVIKLRFQFIIAQLHLQGAGASPTGKSKGTVNSLKSAASGLTPAKREANCFLREATTLTQVSGSTSSGTQAARRWKCSKIAVGPTAHRPHQPVRGDWRWFKLRERMELTTFTTTYKQASATRKFAHEIGFF